MCFNKPANANAEQKTPEWVAEIEFQGLHVRSMSTFKRPKTKNEKNEDSDVKRLNFPLCSF